MSDINTAVEAACARIAPTWPLDRFIAVNPFWPLTHRPIKAVAADLTALSSARMLMPRSWYAEEWRAGRLRSEHVREAIEETGQNVTEDDLVALFWSGEPTPARRPLVVDTLETLSKREHELTWRDFVMEKISRFSASYFDDGQALMRGVREGGFYASWRVQSQTDLAPFLLMGLGNYYDAVQSLPATADEMIAKACADLGIPDGERERYFSALLLDVNGWASWCAYLKWTARLSGGDDNHLRELLAICLGWEWVLYRASDDAISAEWKLAMTSWAGIDKASRRVFAQDWILQRAVEIAWLSRIRTKLPGGFRVPRPSGATLQAAFCIDVRSEVFRRALESQGGGIQTLGIAGFFGVPIEYAPLSADDAHPQLPGLLPPKYRVTDTGVASGLETTRRARLDAAYAWKAFKTSSLSSFAFVDTVGVLFAGRLFRDAFRGEKYKTETPNTAALRDDEDAQRRPRLTSRVDGSALSADERTDIAAGLLRALGLTQNFARLVLLVGHGSETRNNAHAAGLDCGACGGQPGDVNARAAAALLNDAPIRGLLAERGIEIPSTTRFVAGLHNTTTEEVSLFDTEAMATHAVDLEHARTVLARAAVAARRERAPRFGLAGKSDSELHAAAVKRARNWAEVRPEWGLAGNAAFIIAARERTRHMDLEGRVFLHEYRADEDPDHKVLEAIMTGPMVVTHWINFQYYASTVDNFRYGCGDKVLHNIVGGHIGVFEGNAGDLRVGLSLQSLHDGKQWVHTPVRLAVFIDASRDAIIDIMTKHPKVGELVDNEWIHLFQIDAAEGVVYARKNGDWERAPG